MEKIQIHLDEIHLDQKTLAPQPTTLRVKKLTLRVKKLTTRANIAPLSGASKPSRLAPSNTERTTRGSSRASGAEYPLPTGSAGMLHC